MCEKLIVSKIKYETEVLLQIIVVSILNLKYVKSVYVYIDVNNVLIIIKSFTFSRTWVRSLIEI